MGHDSVRVLRARLQEQRERRAQAARAKIDGKVADESDAWALYRASAGGVIPDDLVDAHLRFFRASLEQLVSDPLRMLRAS